MMISTSNNPGDKFNCIQNGAEIYFVKPELYSGWKEMARKIFSFCNRSRGCIPGSLKRVPAVTPYGRLWLHKW
jgi:hypothetical protein